MRSYVNFNFDKLPAMLIKNIGIKLRFILGCVTSLITAIDKLINIKHV